MVGMVGVRLPAHNKFKTMLTELELINKFEQLLAEQSHMANLYRQYGRVPIEQREKVSRMRREVKALCAERRLAIIRERNQQQKQPQQAQLFS